MTDQCSSRAIISFPREWIVNLLHRIGYRSLAKDVESTYKSDDSVHQASVDEHS